MTLNVTLTNTGDFSPGLLAKSADVLNNFNNLNAASDPTFTTTGGDVMKRAIAAPVVTSMTATGQTGSTLGVGAYKYVVSFAADGQEGPPSAVVSITTTTGNTNVALANIPTSTDGRVTRRKIYRTAVGGSNFQWVATLGDNSTTTYTDSTADSSISTVKAPVSHPTLGGTLLGGGALSGFNTTTYQGTVNGTVTFGQTGGVTGDSSTAAQGNGSNGYISAGSTGLPTGAAVMSVSCLVKISSNPSGLVVMAGWGTHVANGDFYLVMNSSGQMAAADDSATTGVSSALSTGTWHHVAATYDGTNLRCYVDGALTGGPTAASLNVTTPINGGALAIFATPNGTGAFFGGFVQKVAVFNYCLNLQQIAQQHTLMSGASGNVTYDQQIYDDGATRYYILGDAASSTTAADSSRYLVQITADGQLATRAPVSLDNGTITTNGSGAVTTTSGVTCAGLSTSGGLSVTSGTTSLDNGAITTSGAGAVTTSGGVTCHGLSTSSGIAVPSGTTSLDNGAITTNGSGVITANAPIKLRTGNQETGYCGMQQYAGAAGGTNYSVGVNFKTVLTNVPSSISFSGSTTNNLSAGPSATGGSIYGFNVVAVPSATGSFTCNATYATVGNCLLAVDPESRTVVHHCPDLACGQITTRRFDEIHVVIPFGDVPIPGQYALDLTCPACGAIESFQTGHSLADEQGWEDLPVVDTVHQYHLIRQLQMALGLPTHD